MRAARDHAAREEMMKVEQVMRRDVKLCRPDETLNEAARLMWDSACGCVPVVDESDHVVGIVTDRDVCMAAYTQGLPLAAIPVSVAMSRQVFTCSIGDTLDTAETLMQSHQVRRLPVLGFEDRIVGILALSDIAREAERRKDQRSKDLSPDKIRTTLVAVGHVRRDERLPEI
jgi:CBS domain-containing protein